MKIDPKKITEYFSSQEGKDTINGLRIILQMTTELISNEEITKSL